MIELRKGGHVKYAQPEQVERFKRQGWSPASEKIVLKPAKKTVSPQPAVEEEVVTTNELKGD